MTSMSRHPHALFAVLSASVFCGSSLGADLSRELRVGRAGHAFDHLGNIGEQAEAAAASGATIIYATGLGAVGYLGLPAPEKLSKQKAGATEYLKKARGSGIRL